MVIGNKNDSFHLINIQMKKNPNLFYHDKPRKTRGSIISNKNRIPRKSLNLAKIIRNNNEYESFFF